MGLQGSANWSTPIAIRIVATADNHLGRYYDRMFPQKLEERRSWLRRGFSRAVEHAIRQKAHLFLQAGDLFDTAEPRNSEREFVAEALAALRASGVRTLGIGGNHDTPRTRGGSFPPTPQGTYSRLGGLRLLGDSVRARVGEGESGSDGENAGAKDSSLTTHHSLLPQDPPPNTEHRNHHVIDTELLEFEGVRIALGGMAPDPTLPAGTDPLEGLDWSLEAEISILLVHGSLQGHVYPGAPEPVISKATVERLGVDCLLAGHVHRFASFQWGRTSVVVPGATELMTFGETDSDPGFVYIELAPSHPPEIHHIPVEPQPRRRLILPSSELDGDDPVQTVLERLEAVCASDAMVKVSLVGPITRQRYHDLRVRELAEFGAARCFYLDLDTTGLYVEDDLPRLAIRSGRLSPREELIRYGEETLDAAVTHADRALIREAMEAILGEYE